MRTAEDLNEIRSAIIDAIPQETFDAGTPPKFGQIYVPGLQRKAFAWPAVLVVGARCTGKSTLASVLTDDALRARISAKLQDFPGAQELSAASVSAGFSESTKPNALYPSPVELPALLAQTTTDPAFVIWQSVVARWLAKELTFQELPATDWQETVAWVASNQGKWATLLAQANEHFAKEQRHALLVFDALDRTGADRQTVNTFVRSLLRLASRLASCSNLHLKIFLDKDQYTREVTNFPDASKLAITLVELE